MTPFRQSVWVLLLAALVAPVSLRAQWKVSLKGPATGIVVTSTDPDLQTPREITRTSSVTVNVDCTDLDCKKVSAELAHPNIPATSLPGTNQSATSVTFKIEGNTLVEGSSEAVPDVLRLRFQGVPDPILSVKLIQPGGGPGGGVATTDTSATLPLSKLLATDCSGSFGLQGATYSAEINQGLVVVSPTGNILSPLPTHFDEDDDLAVIVVGDMRLLPLLTVRRTSEFRQVGNITILGQEVDLKPFMSRLQSQRAGCGVDTAHVSNFAPGRGEVTIKTATGQTIGSFDLAVNHLYWGAFSMGVIRTPLLDPTFGLFFNGTDSVITVATDGVKGVDKDTHRILYTVLLTPFVWGRRDVEKPIAWYRHVNPSVGLVLNDVPNNFVAGLTVDLLSSFYLTVGAHAGKVRELDPRSGLTEGSPFAGPATAIPTLKRWHTKAFVGATVDLRAAAQLLRTVLGTVAGQ
jgi:hypothetical protein